MMCLLAPFPFFFFFLFFFFCNVSHISVRACHPHQILEETKSGAFDQRFRAFALQAERQQLLSQGRGSSRRGWNRELRKANNTKRKVLGLLLQFWQSFYDEDSTAVDQASAIIGEVGSCVCVSGGVGWGGQPLLFQRL